MREVNFGVYLESVLGDILLPKKYLNEQKIGDFVDVFIHKDSEDRLIATTLEPYVRLNEITLLKVNDIAKHGAFMDWGLEKDLFVPNSEQHISFELGKKYFIRVCHDVRTDRLIGVGKLRNFLSNETDELSIAQKVDILIYKKTDLGIKVIVNNTYEGLIYHNEIFENLTLGDKKIGYIKYIRPDGKLDIKLSPYGLDSIKLNANIIFDFLEQNEGFLPLNDKSSPILITETLKMSKKNYKKAVGYLLKSGTIALSQDGINLSSNKKK